MKASISMTARPTVGLAASPVTPLPILRYGFYAFVFSIPIEALDIGIQKGIFSLSHVVGFLFLGAALLQPDVSFKKMPRALAYFTAYGFVVICLAVIHEPDYTALWIGNYHSLWINRLVTLLQMLVLFWVVFNLFQDHRLIKGAFVSLGISCVLLSLIQITGGAANAIDQGRFTALSQDANTVGSILSLGLLALLGLAYGRNSGHGQIGVLAWTCFGIIATGIVLTGSRGALLSLIVGVLCLVARHANSAVRVKTGLIAVFTIACLAWASYENVSVRTRWERSLTEGHMAGRENLFPEAWEMFIEKPLAGWGPVSNYVELGRRFGEPSKDTHNLYLWVLTETGLLGSIPFFTALWLCCRAAWSARHGAEGSLPVVLLACVIVVNMSITWLNRKQFWLVLAYALASEESLWRHHKVGFFSDRNRYPPT
jgi:O-antigen ligase